jgi:diguanylate cyclase
MPIQFLLITCLLLSLLSSASSAAIDLSNVKSGALIGANAHFLIDSNASFDLTTLPLKGDPQWQTSSQEIVSLGYTNEVLWLELELINTRELSWFLEVAYPVLDSVEIYLEQPDKTETYRLGDLKNFAERPINHRNFVIPIPALEHDQVLRILLRVKTSTSLQVPVKLWEKTHFYNEEQSTLIWQGMYFGLIFVMTFYNLCLFYYSREAKYIYYAGVFGSFALFQATLSGFSYQFLWPSSPIWNDHALPVFLGFVLFSESIFVRSLLDLKKHAPRFAAFYSGSALLAAVLVISSSFIPYRFAIISLIILALPINFLGLLIGIQKWSEGNKTAQLFTIAWVGTLFGAIILAFSKLGVIERNAFNENALQIGTTISVLWLSFALGEYIAQQNRERQQAKEDALEYALKISKERQDKLSAQAETLRTQKQANENLEMEVKQRTQELQKAMHDLEEANSKLKHISNIDELTGLYNRRFFITNLNWNINVLSVWKRLCRYSLSTLITSKW